MELTRPLDEPTPVELHDGMWYKRDDLLGFTNGVNGKTRTSLWLADRAVAAGAGALVYGGSVRAPALGRVASAAAYTGLDCYLVIGSRLQTARRHPTVAVAEWAKAQFLTCPVAYNPALQKMARDVAATSGGFIQQVPYGVSYDGPELGRFLQVDAGQVDNLPDELETLVVPFGSGNAAAGVLYGLATRRPPAALERVVLVGIGPDRREWLNSRLHSAGVTSLPFVVDHLPLHPHFAEYKDEMPEQLDGIDFHPVYEGKVVRYLELMGPSWWRRDGTTCLWIVGGPL